MSDSERVMRWVREVAAARSRQVVSVPGGVGLLHDGYPGAHDHNRLQLWSPVDGSVAANRAEDVLGGAGLTHRRIDVMSAAVAEQAAAGLGAAGYERSDELVLLHDGRVPPDESHPGLATVVGVDDRVRAATTSWQAEQPDWDPDVCRQLGERIRTIVPVVAPTFLAVVEGEAVLARVDLYVRDGVAQVEELVTEPAGQRRGHATALVNEALRRARAAGAERVFLVADADDWPVTWYRRIGFTDLARMASYSR